jgi:hypothetical protein
LSELPDFLEAFPGLSPTDYWNLTLEERNVLAERMEQRAEEVSRRG